MRSAALLVAILGFAETASAATVLELFHRVKSRVAAGDYVGGLEALKELETEAALPENLQALAALRPSAAFYRGVCLAATGKSEAARSEFAVYIAANPDKGIDRSAYPAGVVAAFEAARKKTARPVPAQEFSALARAYRAMGYPSSTSAPVGPEWTEGPVKYLLTGEESASFRRIGGDSERAEFVTRFWLARNPVPEAAENEFRREFDRRVAFADEHLSQGPIRGSLTDRGMVFVLLGPPSEVLRRPMVAAEDSPEMLTSTRNAPPLRPTASHTADPEFGWKEIWRYGRALLPTGLPYPQVDFVFVTSIDYRKCSLQRDATAQLTLDAARPRPRTTS